MDPTKNIMSEGLESALVHFASLPTLPAITTLWLLIFFECIEKRKTLFCRKITTMENGERCSSSSNSSKTCSRETFVLFWLFAIGVPKDL